MINRTSEGERGRTDVAVADLATSWADLVLPLAGNRPSVGPLGHRLTGRWAQPHRQYHDLAHLAAVLAAVDLLTGHAEEPAAVRLAAWYHDAVYDAGPGDEERSAALAEAELGPAGVGLPPGLVAEVARLVRLTAGHDPAAGDRNGEVLCDADLAILAAPEPEYRDYVQAVRAEYAHVPEREFRAGRAAVLRALLDSPKVFRTPLGRTRWEAAARANVGAELDELEATGVSGPGP